MDNRLEAGHVVHGRVFTPYAPLVLTLRVLMIPISLKTEGFVQIEALTFDAVGADGIADMAPEISFLTGTYRSIFCIQPDWC